MKIVHRKQQRLVPVAAEGVKQIEQAEEEPKSLKKPSVSDFVTIKQVQDLQEKLYSRIVKEKNEITYSPNVVQYLFMTQTQQSRDKQDDQTFLTNVGETMWWPANATIVSAHVQHSPAGASTLRMYSYSSSNTRQNIASSESAPYSHKNLNIHVPQDTKIWFAVSTTNVIPTASVVLGIIFHAVDLISAEANKTQK